ncbi:MAG: efflux RND transporter periplasmic adaptor subunit [Acidobacteriales bacterium]|nr:efflux RND transporter periplasmic adaptor subunit [Terriglobales bacterium]
MKPMGHKSTIATLLAAAMISGCSSAPAPVANAAPVSPQPVAAVAPANSDVLATAPITVENQVELLSMRDGDVASIAADLGTAVQKGQVLASLDERQLVAERDAQASKVKSIDADLKNWDALTKVADAERDRAEAMWKANLITKQEQERAAYKAQAARFEVERQREDLNEAKAKLLALDVELGRSKITAPFAGMVARRYVTVGQRVNKGDKLFWVTATAPLRIRVMLPERYIGQIKMGSELMVEAVNGPGKEYRAKIVRMSPVVDPSSGTFEVVAEIAGSPAALRPGMTAQVKPAK